MILDSTTPIWRHPNLQVTEMGKVDNKKDLDATLPCSGLFIPMMDTWNHMLSSGQSIPATGFYVYRILKPLTICVAKLHGQRLSHC